MGSVSVGKRPPLIVRCLRSSLSDSVFSDLLRRLSEYGGEFLLFSLTGQLLPTGSWKRLLSLLKYARAVRTLEMLEFDEIDTPLRLDMTRKRLQSIFKHVRSL
jgi:hypothetical protein